MKTKVFAIFATVKNFINLKQLQPSDIRAILSTMAVSLMMLITAAPCLMVLTTSASCNLLDPEKQGVKEEDRGPSMEELETLAIPIAKVREMIGQQVWVRGYIIGGDLTSKNVSFEYPFSSASNIALAPEPDWSQREGCLSVSLPSGSIRNALNLVTNDDLLGRLVYIKGEAVPAYFGLIGLKPATDYRLPETVPASQAKNSCKTAD